MFIEVKNKDYDTRVAINITEISTIVENKNSLATIFLKESQEEGVLRIDTVETYQDVFDRVRFAMSNQQLIIQKMNV